MRLYSELQQVIDRSTIVIGDGGDFVSYAGRVIETYEPGCWMDPGPYGCLGSGPGYAIAAKLARPDRQVCLLLGDGAFGFAGLEFDTMVRHGLPVVGVMGNNGIWALEKHPMEFLYGYSVAADLQPELRYDKVVEALGGHGELVTKPDELKPALERAFASGKPALVNVLTDPTVVYPRKSNLAVEREPPPRGRRFKLAPSGRAGVRAMKGPNGSDGGRRRYDAASPEPMYRAIRGLPNSTSLLTRRGKITLGPAPVPIEHSASWPWRVAARASVADAASSAAPCRMSASLVSIQSKSKARIASARMIAPATIVGARSGWRPVTSRRSASGRLREVGEDLLHGVAVEPVAVDALRVVGVERQVDGGELGRGARHRDAGGGVAAHLARDLRLDDRRHLARHGRELLVRRRVVGQVALGLAHRARARRDVEGRGRRPARRPRTPCCRRRCRARAAGRRPAGGRSSRRGTRAAPPRRPRSSAPRRRSGPPAPGGTPRRSWRRARRSWRRPTTFVGAVRVDRLAERRRPSRTPASSRRRRACRPSRRPRPRRVTSVRRSSSSTRPSRHVRDEQTRRVRPEVDDRDALHRIHAADPRPIQRDLARSRSVAATRT